MTVIRVFIKHLFYKSLGGYFSNLFLLIPVPDSENLLDVFLIFSVFLFICDLFISGAAVTENYDSKKIKLIRCTTSHITNMFIKQVKLIQ